MFRHLPIYWYDTLAMAILKLITCTIEPYIYIYIYMYIYIYVYILV